MSAARGRSRLVVLKGAAVPAGLDALHDEHIGAAGDGCRGLLGEVTVTHTSEPAPREPPDRLRVGGAERERDDGDGDGIVRQQVDFPEK